MNTPNRSTRRGFTLVEVLLGTLLLLVVLGIILLLLRSVTAVQSTQMDRAAQETLDAFHQNLGTRLSHIAPTGCDLETRENRLQFCTLEDAGPNGETDLIQWRYTLLEDEGLEVVRGQGLAATTNILVGVTRFAAFRRARADTDWSETDGNQEMPVMLRVESELETGEQGACDVYLPASLTTRSGIERR